MPETPSWKPAIFERIYRQSDDPWGFETSEYESQKRAATLETLGNTQQQFGSGFEVGCATGVLTSDLARLCKRLLAVDVATRALSFATRRCNGVPHVEIRRMQVPQEWPDSCFDLIVLSEVLYFLSRKDVAVVAERAVQTLYPSGFVLLVNWTGATNTPCTGDEVAMLFMAETLFTPLQQKRYPSYRIDLLANERQSGEQTAHAMRFAR